MKPNKKNLSNMWSISRIIAVVIAIWFCVIFIVNAGLFKMPLIAYWRIGVAIALTILMMGIPVYEFLKEFLVITGCKLIFPELIDYINKDTSNIDNYVSDFLQQKRMLGVKFVIAFVLFGVSCLMISQLICLNSGIECHRTVGFESGGGAR